jgi:hypothetical protein
MPFIYVYGKLRLVLISISDCCVCLELYLSITQDSIVVKCLLININRKWYIAGSI